MKIGILTLRLHLNYGGILQAYALQKHLEELGHEVMLIDRHHNTLSLFLQVKRWVKKYLLFRKSSQTWQKDASKNIDGFVSKYFIHKTQPIKSEKELRKWISRSSIEAVIVGSDQVWRTEYTRELAANYFLDFVGDDIKKFSYAASFGNDEWNQSQGFSMQIKGLLARFDAVSVREESAIVLCQNVFGTQARHHIDPTLLLHKEHYLRLINNHPGDYKTGGIFAYILDNSPDKNRLVETVSSALNKSIDVLHLSKYYKEFTGNVLPSVESWLANFYHADYVVTDSFHGCVFSIIFNKPFIAIGNKERGMTRFLSLLRLFNLENRIALDFEDFDESIIHSPIDWPRVNELILKKRQEADDYLSTLLGKL